LHEDLGRWIPKLLNPEQKLCWQHICEQILGALSDDEELFSKIMTGDETWGYHWDPPRKQESMGWVHKGSPPPKKTRTQNSSLMATVFWNMEESY
jgi:hypothetical protein